MSAAPTEALPAGKLRMARRSWASWALAVVVAWALAGLAWTPWDPDAQIGYELRRSGPTTMHWLGVDSLGRDVLSRVWGGTGHTVVFGAAAAAGTLALAAVLLLFERRGPRVAGPAVSVLASAGLALPVVFVGLILAVFMPRSPWTLVLACAVGGAPFGYRQLRTMWREQTGALYVVASRALGARPWHIVWFTIWPNIRPQVAALARLMFAVGVLELSGLSFLGLAGDPDLVELGAILRQNQSELFLQPWLVIWPGVVLSGLLLLVHAAHSSADGATNGGGG